MKMQFAWLVVLKFCYLHTYNCSNQPPLVSTHGHILSMHTINWSFVHFSHLQPNRSFYIQLIYHHTWDGWATALSNDWRATLVNWSSCLPEQWYCTTKSAAKPDSDILTSTGIVLELNNSTTGPSTISIPTVVSCPHLHHELSVSIQQISVVLCRPDFM